MALAPSTAISAVLHQFSAPSNEEKMMSNTSVAIPEAPNILTPSVHKKIWIDLDNSPHVPFFRPIIDELRKKGYEVFLTARDAYQVRELLEYYGVDGKVIGRHYGKHKLFKALGTCWRAVVLTAMVRKEKPDISVCHGSRGCLITSKLLNIPNLTLTDYEFTASVPSMRPTWIMVPSVNPCCAASSPPATRIPRPSNCAPYRPC